jgi:hypothetical protein
MFYRIESLQYASIRAMHFHFEILQGGCPEHLAVKLDSEQKWKAYVAYYKAYVANKAAIEAHDEYDDHRSPTNPSRLQRHFAKISRLRQACEISWELRKQAWRILMDMLKEDYGDLE